MLQADPAIERANKDLERITYSPVISNHEARVNHCAPPLFETHDNGDSLCARVLELFVLCVGF
jgi:hypothetical protein